MCSVTCAMVLFEHVERPVTVGGPVHMKTNSQHSRLMYAKRRPSFFVKAFTCLPYILNSI